MNLLQPNGIARQRGGGPKPRAILRYLRRIVADVRGKIERTVNALATAALAQRA
jgi:hypothetical protein